MVEFIHGFYNIGNTVSEMNDVEFFTDRDIGRILGISPNTIRVQRHYRRNGKDHYLKIDPVMIGSLPRYTKEDVANLIANLKENKIN